MKRPEWQQNGREPDYRFTLANERTFLAWIRTALAGVAGGVLLDQFAGHLQPTRIWAVVAVSLVLLAALLAGCAYYRWKGNEIAMRHSGPLPAASGVPFLSGAIGCVALVLAGALMIKWG